MLWCVRRLVAMLLAEQQLPQHVAFIPDGNRRFAAQLGLKAIIGHYLGNKKLKHVVHWCRELGIRYVTIYAFSTDNFNRSAEEVARLMKLARAQFEALVNDEDIPKWRAEVRVIGDLSTLPPAVAAAAAHAMTSSQQRSQTIAVLNVSFSYTSSEDLQSAVQQVVASVAQHQVLPSDITPGLLQQVMHTRECPPVDLLIRTSGEQRLSDFLLWQSSYALLHWERCLWPEFGYAQLLRALLAWQSAAAELLQLRQAAGRATQHLWRQPSCQEEGSVEEQSQHQGCQQQQQQQPAGDWSSGMQLRVDSFFADFDKRNASQVHQLAAGAVS